MGPLITRRGLFIHTKSTRPVGSEIQFEFQLADGSIKYSGEGVVRKEIPFTEQTAAKSGMLIALRRVNRAFKDVVDIVLSADKANPPQEAKAQTEAAESKEAESASEEASAPKQNIVEQHAGDGLDIFGDLDMDEGLDSLFSSIEKPGSLEAAPKVQDSFKPMRDQEPSFFDEDLFAPSEDNETIDWLGEDAEVLNENYQDAPTPQPMDYVASAYNELPSDSLDARSQRKTGEFEAVEYIAEAERQLCSGQYSPVPTPRPEIESQSKQNPSETPTPTPASFDKVESKNELNPSETPTPTPASFDRIESKNELNPSDTPTPMPSVFGAGFMNEEVREALNLLATSPSGVPIVSPEPTLEMTPSSMFEDTSEVPTQTDLKAAQAAIESETPIVDHVTEELQSLKSAILSDSDGKKEVSGASKDEVIGHGPLDAEAERIEREETHVVSKDDLRSVASQKDSHSSGYDGLSMPSNEEESPSELFAALHDDILGKESEESSESAAPQTLSLASINSEQTADHKESAPAQTDRNASQDLEFFNTPRARKNEQVQLEDLLKRADIKTQDTKDIVMTNVSKKKAQARRRVVAEEAQLEIPQEKKGFFSSLFKK
ncbi:MAG: hypothetical protein J6A01_06165 [Proteobacteria bacterium]|nr:hypothetical protein [Pseudomonadota bacterium]